MNFVFKTQDHPEAMGQTPDEEAEEFQQHFVTDEGATLTIRMGRKTAIGVAAVVLRILNDDLELAKEAKALARTIKKT